MITSVKHKSVTEMLDVMAGIKICIICFALKVLVPTPAFPSMSLIQCAILWAVTGLCGFT